MRLVSCWRTYPPYNTRSGNSVQTFGFGLFVTPRGDVSSAGHFCPKQAFSLRRSARRGAARCARRGALPPPPLPSIANPACSVAKRSIFQAQPRPLRRATLRLLCPSLILSFSTPLTLNWRQLERFQYPYLNRECSKRPYLFKKSQIVETRETMLNALNRRVNCRETLVTQRVVNFTT